MPAAHDATTSVLWLSLLPFAGAVILAWVPRSGRKLSAWIAGITSLGALAVVLFAAPAVFDGTVLRWSITWVPQLGLDFGLRMDGLAWLFALMITAIGALVVLYAAYYLSPDDPAPRFFQFLLLFMGAMLGLVLADNLLLMVVFWEGTSLASFLLIGYWSHREDAREGAKMALTITGAGGLALLAGVVIIGHIVGSYRLDDVLAAGATVRAHPLYLPALLLVLAGAFTKSAQFPLHFWLPYAMAAPTPVSAYLHSATMVKAGVFLLARFYPVLGQSDEWFWIVSLTGLATLIIGAAFAIFQHDLKGLLAYSTISHLGLITLLFGLDDPMGVVAGVFHLLNHATFKASLFMAVGIIDHETGSRDMRRLSGLRRTMPWTAALGIVAAAAMAGVPLLNGFLSKEMFFGVAVTQGGGIMGYVLPIGATLAGIFSVAYSTRFIHDVFFGPPPTKLDRVPHEPPRFMRVPVDILVIACLAVGVAPALTVGTILPVAAAAVLQGPLPEYSLALWHGFNLPLAMSVVALIGGVALYFGLRRMIDLHAVTRLARGGREIFLFVTMRAISAARSLTLALQNGSLQRYLFLLVIMALLAGALPWLTGGAGAWRAPREAGPVVPSLVVLLVAGMAAALAATIVHRRRLHAVLLLGAVGLIVSWLFVALSAPDLALTQLLVEVVTIVLMLLALHWLPQTSPNERWPLRRRVHAVIAVAAGLGMAALSYALMMLPSDSIAPYYLAHAKSLGGGANVVNVMLVDFRAFDTLGEIAVLGIAALVVAALLRDPQRSARAHVRAWPRASMADSHPLMMEMGARLLLPFAVIVAIFLFLRGHNQPGGGFIAGLAFAIGLILQYLANGRQWTDARLPSDFRPWIGWGLVLAALTGLGSLLLGSPLLTSTYDYPRVPLIGAVPLTSALPFDLGVFLAVVGATMVMLSSIGRLEDETALPPAAGEKQEEAA